MSARVKSVSSADTIVLTDKQKGDEVQLSLAYVTAPRINEPWGFDAREYLRTFALAKPVSYKVLYDVNNREYGDAASPVFKSLIEHMLLQGWAKLRDDCEGKPGYADYGARLQEAQAQAQARKAGIWTDRTWKPLNVRSVVPESLYGSGRQVPAIVERVISGDRVVLRAMMDPDDHFVGHALLAGIKTHRTTSSVGGGDALGDAAADLVSTRMLQRSQVRAVFLVPSKTNSDLPLVTLKHPQGDIALVLVQMGLAEVPNVPEIGAERLALLRNAQTEAQSKGVGMYRAAALARQQHAETYSSKASTAVVVKVMSSDTLVVEPGNRTVQLSSTRAPRRNENPVQAAEAREFARKLLIGQSVRIQVDGETSLPPSAAEPGKPQSSREVVTLLFGPQFARNAALEIIRAGWATALRHRRDDLSRSPFYSELMAAEEAAQSAKRGIFADPSSTKNNKKAQGSVIDASESVVRARGYLTSLQRRSRIPAIIDNVISAGRYRISVPSENCTLVAVLDGVRVPRASEPYAEEALQYTTREWNQRDVEISVRSVDKTGAFVASILKGSRSLAIDLLENGFASIHEGSANASGLRNVYDEAQEEAQAGRKGIWENYEAEEEPSIGATAGTATAGVGQLNLSDSDTAAKPAYEDAVISHVTLDAVYIRLAPADAKFKQLKQDLQKFFTASVNTSARSFTQKPRRRDTVVLADSYERGVITAVVKQTGSSTYEVELIDSGRTQTVSVSEIYPIPKEYAAAPPLARPLVLRYVHRPVKFYEKLYLDYVSQFVNQQVVVIGDIIYTADSKNSDDSLNTRIIAHGCASVPQSQTSEPGAQAALQIQEEVKANRVGMWEYGDPREDEDL